MAAEANGIGENGVAVRRRSFEAFVQDDLVQYSLADLRRSLPSAIDGLKPSQRESAARVLRA